MLGPIKARFAPRPLDGGTSPEPKEKPDVELEISPVEMKFAESAIDETVTIETVGTVEASPGGLDAEIEVETPEKPENVQTEIVTQKEGEVEAPPSGVEEVLTVVTVTNVEQSVDMWGSDDDDDIIIVAPSSGGARNQEEKPDDLKMAAGVTMTTALSEEVIEIESAPKVERSPGVLDLKLASDEEGQNDGTKEVTDAPPDVIDEVLQIETAPQAETAVDIFDLEDDTATPIDENGNATADVVEDVLVIESVPQVEKSVDILDLKDDEIAVVENEKETTDVVEDVLVIESVPQVETSVDMLELKDGEIGAPSFGRNDKAPRKTTELNKKVDILIIGDHEADDLVLSGTSKIPEKETMELETDLVPVTADAGKTAVAVVTEGPGSKDDAADSANGSLQSFIIHDVASDDNYDNKLKVRSEPVALSVGKEESILLKEKQDPFEAEGQTESAPPGGKGDDDSLDDFFGNSDVTQLLGGDEDQPKDKESDVTKATMSDLPPLRLGARAPPMEIDIDKEYTKVNMADQPTVSPPTGDQLNDSMNNFLGSDRRKLKRDSLDDGGFWERQGSPTRRPVKRNRRIPAEILEQPEENGHNTTPSGPMAVPSGSDENDSIDGALLGENDVPELLQKMKPPKDSDFHSEAFVAKDGSDAINSGVTMVMPLNVESDSEEDILSPMIRKTKNKKTFITES
jgi:hypothetical protein